MRMCWAMMVSGAAGGASADAVAAGAALAGGGRAGMAGASVAVAGAGLDVSPPDDDWHAAPPSAERSVREAARRMRIPGTTVGSLATDARPEEGSQRDELQSRAYAQLSEGVRDLVGHGTLRCAPRGRNLRVRRAAQHG